MYTVKEPFTKKYAVFKDTNIWNNKRDSTVEFDWQTYVPQRHGTIASLGYLQSSSTEAICLQPWTSCTEKFVFWKFLSHELQHRLRDSERKIRRYMLLKKFHHPFQFTIRIPPQHSIWPGCEPLKEVYTSIVGGFLFSYWIAFQQKCYCLFVYGALGTTQNTFISRRAQMSWEGAPEMYDCKSLRPGKLTHYD